MLEIKSKSLKDYIGTTPDEYTLKYHHYSLEIIDEKEEYSLVEQDINNIFEYSKNTFMLYFSRIKDLKVALNNTNLIDKYHSDSYLRIRNNKEYEEYKSLNTNLNLIIELKDLSSINTDRDSIVIQIDNVSELSIDELLVLNEKHLITGILLGQIAYIKNNFLDLIKELSDKYNIPVSNQLEIEKNNEITNDIYTVYDYMMLLNEIKRIIDETKDNDLIKHMHNIFLYLARSIYYDDEGVEHTNIDNQNLIGPLCNKKAVCEGYSKVIYQIYSLLGIETTVISGGISKEEGGHIWNQVKVFNDWYNVDVTCQSTSEHNNLGFDWFLIKDDKCLFKPASPFAKEVINDFKEIEYRTLYDENRNATGEAIKKGETVPKGRYYNTVAIFIENSNNEFLLQIKKKYNMWSTTGGHPKYGESSLDGIVSEIKEELGLIVNSKDIKLIKTYKTEDDFVDLYYLRKNINIDELTLQEEEVDTIKWFNKNEIEDLIKNDKFLLPHIDYFKDCLEYLKK